VDFLCDGTNDLAQFDAAVAALGDNGGEIKILDGTYTLSAPWTIDSYCVNVSGSGADNTILNMTGPRSGGMDLEPSTDCVIYLSGNYCVIEGLTLSHGDDGTSQDANSCGLYMDGAQHCVVRNNIVANATGLMPAYGIYAYYSCRYNNISANYIKPSSGAGTYGMYILGSNSFHNVVAENNFAMTGPNLIGLLLGSGVSDSSISKNEFRLVATGGSSARGISADSTDAVSIEGNNIVIASTGGADSKIYSMYLSNSANSTIANNTLIGSNSQSSGEYYGIYLSAASSSAISGNVIDIAGAVCYGIYLNAVSTSAISGNTLTNSDSSASTIIYCLALSGANFANTVTGNVFVGPPSTHVSAFGLYINGTSSTYNTFSSNNFRPIVKAGGISFTRDGAVETTLPGSATTAAAFASTTGTTNVSAMNVR
jgi:putative cofactor-binding repeat protein